jgi:hypothetical protein
VVVVAVIGVVELVDGMNEDGVEVVVKLGEVIGEVVAPDEEGNNCWNATVELALIP